MAFKPLIKGVLLLANWEIDAGAAFKRIPNEYKACYRVTTPELHKPAYRNHFDLAWDFNIIPHHYDIKDGVIPDYASICHSKSLWERIQSFVHNHMGATITSKFNEPHANAEMVKAKDIPYTPGSADQIKIDDYQKYNLPDEPGHNLSQADLIIKDHHFMTNNSLATNAKKFSNDFFDQDPTLKNDVFDWDPTM